MGAVEPGVLISKTESEICTGGSLGNADRADRDGRGVEVALGPESFGVAEILILLCSTAAGVRVPLEGAPLLLHQVYGKGTYQNVN